MGFGFVKNTVLRLVSSRAIKKNRKFYRLHDGESCYIFGNGASLKYFDFRVFKDKPVICCGALFFHKDFSELNVKYYYGGGTYFYYPYWRHERKGSIEKNPLGVAYAKRNIHHKSILHFTSLSNFFGYSAENFYYLHHFDNSFNGFDNCKMDGVFSAMAGGLSGMLGIAIYMGFKDITLVGCDYTMHPQMQGHFYDFGVYADTSNELPHAELFLTEAMKHARLRCVTPNASYRGHIINSITYEELTGDLPRFRENDEIILHKDLVTLDSCNLNYKIFCNK